MYSGKTESDGHKISISIFFSGNGLHPIKAAESEIQELEEALETLLKKYEAEQEHSNTLEGELEELSDRQQQEIADLETKVRFILDNSKLRYRGTDWMTHSFVDNIKF